MSNLAKLKSSATTQLVALIISTAVSTQGCRGGEQATTGGPAATATTESSGSTHGPGGLNRGNKPSNSHGSTNTPPRAGRFHASEHNSKHGAPSAPILYFGQGNDLMAEAIAAGSTFNGLAVDTLEQLDTALAAKSCIGFVAMSREDDPGGAGRAIALFHRYHGDQEPIHYIPWANNVERAAARALEYGADAILMGGMLQNELVDTVIDTLRRVKTKKPRPATVDDYIANLKRTAPKSPFWEIQGLPPEKYIAGRYYDPDVIY